MTENWQWPGARWWKCDLHLHTPASYDFAERDSVTPEQWVEAARAKGLEVVAVTDHETADWVEKIRSAASVGEPPLAVFPGVEINSREGVHLIVLFEPGTLPGRVDDLLAQCGIGVEMRGKRGVNASLGFLECLSSASGQHALAIAAHADRAASPGKGETSLLRVVKAGNPLNQILASPYLRAAEVWTENEEQSGRLKRPLGHEDLPPLGLLSSSDGHSLEQIGNRFTWIKMTRPDLEGLRLAIEDGPLSLRRSLETEGDPNRHAPLAIESMTVTDGRYMGRGSPFTVRLNPWLNAIIGGRGTGKSSLVELLRIAMRREQELPEKLRRDLENLTRIPALREDPGILQEATQIEVIYRKDGRRFRIRWTPQGSVPSIEKEGPGGTWQEDTGKVQERFPLRIFSQKQIFELASQPEALLGVVDDAPPVRGWQESWRQEEARFLALRARGREIETHLEEGGQLLAELADLGQRLEVFEASAFREILTAYQRRQRQKRALEEWTEGLKALGARLGEVTAQWRSAPIPAELFDESEPADRGVLEVARATEGRLSESLEDLARQVATSEASFRESSGVTLWREHSQSAEEAFKALEGNLQSQGIGDSNEYGRLVQRRAHLAKRLSDLEGERRALQEIAGQAEESLGRLAALRKDLTDRRTRFLEEVLGSNRYVRMAVIPFGQRQRAEQDLHKILGSEKYARDFQKLVAELYPKDSSEGSEGIEERLLVLKARLRAGSTGPAAPTTSTFEDARFATLLRAVTPEAWDRLDLWFPEDSLTVRYSPGGNGRDFRSLDQGSPGQKAAALLAFFLSYGEEPLILDQPEDDLDNQLITELIVRQLRENKQRRQMLIVTHNPNIVVNGDAELVLVFTSSGGQSHVISQGGLQEAEVRNAICEVMEGGREAFLLRYRRLGRSTADV